LVTAGAGALSAKHEEIPLGYPRPTVNWLLCGTVKTVPYGKLFFCIRKKPPISGRLSAVFSGECGEAFLLPFI